MTFILLSKFQSLIIKFFNLSFALSHILITLSIIVKLSTIDIDNYKFAIQISIEIKLAKKEKRLQIVAKIKTTKNINKKLILIEFENKISKNKFNRSKKIQNSIDIVDKKTNNLFEFSVDLKYINL